jgi:hypothetical protein
MARPTLVHLVAMSVNKEDGGLEAQSITYVICTHAINMCASVRACTCVSIHMGVRGGMLMLDFVGSRSREQSRSFFTSSTHSPAGLMPRAITVIAKLNPDI